MITPFISLICIIVFNGLWLWKKHTLIKNGYDVSWFYGYIGDIPKMFHLADKTKNQQLRISYKIRGWLLPLSIPVLIAIIFNTTL